MSDDSNQQKPGTTPVNAEARQAANLEANSVSRWDALWAAEGEESWRKRMLKFVYQAIHQELSDLCSEHYWFDPDIADVGGGRGFFAEILTADRFNVVVWDHSPVALDACKAKGIATWDVDLENVTRQALETALEYIPFVVATEFYEHLSEGARAKLREACEAAGCVFIISVPNDRLGPSIEPQHTVQFTAESLETELRKTFKDVRVYPVRGLGIVPMDEGYLVAVAS